MPNLVKNLKASCKDVFKDKILLTLLVIIAVVAVNQIVFSCLLVDRESAKAATVLFGNDAVGNVNYPTLLDQFDSVLPPRDYEPHSMVVDEANGFAYLGMQTDFGTTKVVKVRLSDFTRVDELLVAVTGRFQHAHMDDNGYAYFVAVAFPSKVVRIRLSDFTHQGTVELESNESYTGVIDNVRNFGYFASQSWITKVDLTTFTRVGAIDTGGDRLLASAIDEVNGFAYFGESSGGYYDPSHVYKINVNNPTFSLHDTILFGSGEDVQGGCMAIEGNNLWVTTQHYPAKLIKIDITGGAFTRVTGGEIEFEYDLEANSPPLYVNGVRGILMDSTNQLVYLLMNPYYDPTNWPANVALKINLVTEDVDILMLDTLTGGQTFPWGVGIDHTNHKAYFSDINYPAYIEKVDLTGGNFSREAQLPLAVSLDRSRSATLDTVNGFLYVGSRVDPPIIAKIDLDTFLLDSTLALDSDLYTEPYQAGVDTIHNYAYFGVTYKIMGNPHALLKINLNTFSVEDVVDFDGLAFAMGVVIIDPDNQIAYVGERYGNRVLKVDLDTMSLVDTLTITEPNETSWVTGFIDRDNDYLYLASYGSPGMITRINLTTFSRDGVVDLTSYPDEKQFTAAVMDPVNGYAYFFGLWGPLVKVNIDPTNFSREGVVTTGGATGSDPKIAGIDVNQGYVYLTSNDKLWQIDIDPSRTYAVASQTTIPERAYVLIDSDQGYLYLVKMENNPLGIDKYGYSLAGYIHGYKVTLTEDVENVEVFKFYSHEDAGSLRFALYDASKNLLWESNEIVNTVADSWITIPVSSGTPGALPLLTAGDYWLAFQINTAAPVASYTDGGEGFKLVRRYDTFPSTISGETVTTALWSFYGALEGAGRSTGGVIIPTPPFDLTCQALNSTTIRWFFEDTSTNETGFVLYGPEGAIWDSGPDIVTDLAYIDETGLQPNTLYADRYVTAYSGEGESAPSNTASCTTLADGEVMPSPEMPELPAAIEVGDIIKGINSNELYLVSSAGQKRLFPTETIYNSWFTDYSAVKEVSTDTLSQIPLGPNMILRPGTWLMKITSDPKVYAVEPNGIIRWIETEAIALSLYGTAWNQRIIDMPDTYFVDYVTGSSIATSQYATGTLLQYKNTADIYYVENGSRRLVLPQAFTQSHFQMQFVITNVDPVKFQLTEGEAWPVDYDYTMTMTQQNKSRFRR